MARFASDLSGTPLTVVREEDLAGAPPLAAAETAHLEKLPHPKRRSEWHLGRLAAKAALARASGAAVDELVVIPGPDGAPAALRSGSVLPFGLSISHGHGRAVAWAVEDGLPGVDLER